MNLSHIAADLRHQAHATGQPAKTRLSRGLALSYKRIDRQCVLAAGRQDVYPSPDEALIIARAFGVPLGTEPNWAIITQRPAPAPLPHSGGGAGGGGIWHIITWAWLEVERPQQPALIPPAAAYP